ncbi:MAG TPA: hypothetical protein VIJ15_01365 [Dermatophilaceae bacterium]
MPRALPAAIAGRRVDLADKDVDHARLSWVAWPTPQTTGQPVPGRRARYFELLDVPRLLSPRQGWPVVIWAILIPVHEWQVSDRRYLSVTSMAMLTPSESTVLTGRPADRGVIDNTEASKA